MKTERTERQTSKIINILRFTLSTVFIIAAALILEEVLRWAGAFDSSFLNILVLDSFDKIDGFRFAMYTGLTILTIAGSLYISID